MFNTTEVTTPTAAPVVSDQHDPRMTPLAAPGWRSDPSGRQQLRYWDGRTWTEHTSPVGAVSTVALSPQPTADDVLIRRLTAYARWSGIAWIILALLQILSVVAVVAGLWNLFAGYTRIRAAPLIAARDPGIPAAFQGLAGYLIIGLINLFLGAGFGVVLVGVDLFVRDQILKNARLFEPQDV